MKNQTKEEVKKVELKVNFDGEYFNEAIEKAVYETLKSENIDFDCEIEIMIVDEQTIRDINNQTRNIDRVTDVLSFPMFETVDDMESDESGNVFLGSMVICQERAKTQAEEYGHSELREASFLAVHSTLHLLGYDHELGENEEREMFAKQEAVLDKMGITR